MRKISSSREPAVQELVQLARRREVVAERLLDDQPHPALLRAPLPDLRHRRGERLRRHGEVVEPVAAGAALGVELLERAADAVLALVVVELGADVAHPGRERVPHVLPERVAGELLHRLLHGGGELGRASAESARRRRSRTPPAGACGTRARRGPGSACASSGRPRRRRSRPRTAPGRRRSCRPSSSGLAASVTQPPASLPSRGCPRAAPRTSRRTSARPPPRGSRRRRRSRRPPRRGRRAARSPRRSPQ